MVKIYTGYGYSMSANEWIWFVDNSQTPIPVWIVNAMYSSTRNLPTVGFCHGSSLPVKFSGFMTTLSELGSVILKNLHTEHRWLISDDLTIWHVSRIRAERWIPWEPLLLFYAQSRSGWTLVEYHHQMFKVWLKTTLFHSTISTISTISCWCTFPFKSSVDFLKTLNTLMIGCVAGCGLRAAHWDWSCEVSLGRLTNAPNWCAWHEHQPRFGGLWWIMWHHLVGGLEHDLYFSNYC